MNKKKLIWGGSILVGTTLLLIIYFAFNLLGISQSLMKKYELVITTESAEKLYDGTPLSSNNWSLQSGKLVPGHSMKVTMKSSITYPGSIPNEIGVTIFDEKNNNVTSNYKIIYDLGKLTVLQWDITIQTESREKFYDGAPLSSNNWSLQSGTLMSGHRIEYTMASSITYPGSIPNEIGITILDENNNDVSSLYNIIYNLGELTVFKWDITIQTGSSEKFYDGTPLTNNNWSLQSGVLMSGHSINTTMTSSITNPGSIPNEIGVTIIDTNNQDVTGIYNITYNLGTLTVFKWDITIQTDSSEKIYDGTPLTNNNWSIESGQLYTGHSIDFTMVSSITKPGSVQNKIGVTILDENNKDVTSIYNITYNLGTLTVLKRDITIQTGSSEKFYDGTPLTSNTWLIQDGTLVNGHSIDATMTSSITYPGSTQNKIGVTILDENSNDVTGNYNITYNLGTLTVFKWDITIQTESSEKTYDGTPLTNNTWLIQSGTLMTGHSIEVTMTSSITNPGSIQNKIGVTILDENNNNVTKNYNITYNLGTLTVSKRNITIQTESLDRIYDGTPLTSTTWSIQSGTLVNNHSIETIMTSSITNPGAIPNDIGVTILDENNSNVTQNYNITYNKGTLTVYKRNITIQTGSSEKVYDGSPLTNSNWLLEVGTLVIGHRIEHTMTSSITNPGSILNEIGITILDENSNDVTQNYNIDYNKGNLTVLERDITIQTESLEKTYDGTPLTSSSYTIPSGTLVNDHSIDIIMTTSITNAGSVPNDIQIAILDGNGNNVTGYYNINYNLGTLTVQKISLILLSGSASKVYDGTPLTYNVWSLVYGEVLADHELRVNVTGVITDVGSVDNLMHAYVLDENDNNVTSNYDIELQLGKLTILTSIYSSGNLSRTPPEISDETYLQIFASQSGRVYLRDMSFGNYNGQGWDLGIPYNINLGINPLSFSSLALLESGRQVNTIQIRHLREFIPYLTPYYATNNLNIVNDIHVYGQLESIYSFNYISYDYVSSSKFLLQDQSIIEKESLYRDYVYDNYLAIPQLTRLAMLQLAQQNNLDPSKPTIALDVQRYIQNAATYNLNFQPIPDDVDVAVYFLTVSKEGICQHFATAATLMYRALGIPARYVTGFVGDATRDQWSNITGEQAHAWVEIYIDGMGWVQVEVTGSFEAKPRITVTPKDVKKLYVEGQDPIKATSVDIKGFEDYIDQGYTYHVTFGGELSTIGRETSTITDFIIYDELGNDVTHMFDITYNTGILQLYGYQITLETVDDSKIYNGSSLTNFNWNIIGELGDGHYVNNDQVVFTGQQLNVGMSQNRATLTILDADGNDVTWMYLINYDFGSLTVYPRLITIQSDDATKPYDGSPLICQEYEIVFGSLADGDTLSVVISGTQTNIGSSDNIIESAMITNGSTDVTFNYIIQYIEGKLTVTPAN